METTLSSPNRGRRAEKLQFAQLPEDVHFIILECLVPQLPEIGETKPVSYAQLIEGDPWFDFTRSRRGLANLCLTNRHFLSLAQPRLFHVAALLDEAALILLLRTMVDKPDCATWIRTLSIHLTLTSDNVARETRRAISELMHTFRIPVPRSRVPRKPYEYLCSTMLVMADIASGTQRFGTFVVQMLVMALFLVATRIETLLLQIPVSDEHDDYHFLFSELEGFKFGNADEPHLDRDQPRPLERLETLLLQGDPEMIEYYDGLDEDASYLDETCAAHASVYRRLWLQVQTLKTLEVSGDDGLWENQDDPSGPGARTFWFMHDRPFLGNIRHIYLHNSCAGPTDLHRILRNAPRLETLYMTPSEEIDPQPAEDATHADEEALDTALELYAKNLRHLDVSWHEWYGAEAEIGQNGRLNSLPRLEKLEKLCIQLAVLYGTHPATVLETPLAEQLPPNLVELTLEDWWWSHYAKYEELDSWNSRDMVNHYQSESDYRRTALKMLEQFADDVPKRLPRLRKVLLLCKIPYTWMLEPNIPLDFHFRGVRDTLAAKGIEFLVEDSCDLIECDEGEVLGEFGSIECWETTPKGTSKPGPKRGPRGSNV